MEFEHPQRLRRLHEELAGLSAAPPGPPAAIVEQVDRIRDRLERDLLPRTAGGHDHLVVGIVGPNNAGKSSLFNALVKGRLSPALPTGGATRRLLAAAHPRLRERLQAEPTLARFPLRVLRPEEVETVLQQAPDPAELHLIEVSELPERLLLIDTPDFDSILTENRLSSEALLKVCDLALVVVTRHTYQNREVVRFLEAWLAHGRPWVLVYNESLGSEITAEHSAKLASDVATPPVAVFEAPFDLEVQEGSNELRPTGLRGSDVVEGVALGEWLFDLRRAGELKHRALGASLSQLQDELVVLGALLEEESARAREILELAELHALRLAREAAGRAMPMRPFLEAFRAVLDRRPDPIRRGLRGMLRKGRLLLEGAARRLSPRREAPPTPDRKLQEVEREILQRAWPLFFEELVRELTGLRVVADDGHLALTRLLEDLRPEAASAALERALDRLEESPELLRSFQEACEALIEAELDRRGQDWFLQVAVDLVHLLPAAAAGIVIFHTGGLGWDIAAGGAGVVSSLLAERVSRLLGTQVARSARRRWTELRSEQLARRLVDASLATSAPLLRQQAEGLGHRARTLHQLTEDLSWPSTTPTAP